VVALARNRICRAGLGGWLQALDDLIGGVARGDPPHHITGEYGVLPMDQLDVGPQGQGR
jgi:hypothetical protein